MGEIDELAKEQLKIELQKQQDQFQAKIELQEVSAKKEQLVQKETIAEECSRLRDDYSKLAGEHDLLQRKLEECALMKEQIQRAVQQRDESIIEYRAQLKEAQEQALKLTGTALFFPHGPVPVSWPPFAVALVAPFKQVWGRTSLAGDD